MRTSIVARILAIAFFAQAMTSAGISFADDTPGCLLRIIHTNDLHAQIDHGSDPNLGSFAALKAKIDQLRAQAFEANEEVLVLDAGDFSEGGIAFFANHGADMYRLINQIQYDAIAMGNHDWLAGGSHLDWIASFIPLSFQFLSANFVVSPHLRNLSRVIKPYFSFTKGTKRIAVVGLSTDEIFYRWRVIEDRSATISDPIGVAHNLVPQLRNSHDAVIALTHLGIQTDVSLIANVPGINLIVGGHSHHKIPGPDPIFSRDTENVQVPIVQAGCQGQYVGSVLLNLCAPRGPAQVLSYQLIPVVRSGPRDANIEGQVQILHRHLEEHFGAPLVPQPQASGRSQDEQLRLAQAAGSAWLNTPIARSEIPLGSGDTVSGPNPVPPNQWHLFVARAIRNAVGADIAIDSVDFGGATQSAGDVTRKKIIEAYPRLFDFSPQGAHLSGWRVSTSEISGRMLGLFLNMAQSMGFSLAVDGVDLNRPNALDANRTYRLAMPEGLVRGPLGAAPILSVFIGNSRYSQTLMWTAIEAQFAREAGVLRARGNPTAVSTSLIGR